ncbi:MAG: glycosyltransferase [Oceanicaulis sp.]
MTLAWIGDDHDEARPSEAEAAFGLRDRRPKASAGAPLAPPLRLIAGPLTFLFGLMMFAPGASLAIALGLVGLLVAGVAVLRFCGAVLRPAYAERTPLADADLPRASVIVALHKEAEVCAGLVAALSRLDYPAGELEILLALEHHDFDTIAAARAAARRGGVKVLVLGPCGPTTKPRALNFALQAASGEIVAVYDAEDAPSAGQLRAAAEAFAADPGLGAVQAPLNWYNANDNALTRQFALEYAAQFDALLPAYARLGLPLPLGGTSNVFRRTALEDAGGWDPFNVTEDADLGFRLARHGWRCGLIEPRTLEEAPVTLKAWTGQRSRWLKGHLVTWLVHMRDPRGLAQQAGLRALAGLQLSLLANVLFAGLFAPGLVLLAFSITLALTGTAGFAAMCGLCLAGAAYAAAFACTVQGARRAGVKAGLLDYAAMPVYWLAQGPALLRALREMPGRSYVWVKTRHGVSRTRREAPDAAMDDIAADGAGRRPVRPVGLAQRASVRPASAALHSLDDDHAGVRRLLPDAADPSVQPVRA